MLPRSSVCLLLLWWRGGSSQALVVRRWGEHPGWLWGGESQLARRPPCWSSQRQPPFLDRTVHSALPGLLIKTPYLPFKERKRESQGLNNFLPELYCSTLPMLIIVMQLVSNILTPAFSFPLTSILTTFEIIPRTLRPVTLKRTRM